MAFAITDRPRTWDQIVGQEQPLRILRSIFRKGYFLPRGIVMEGPSGVGKTTTAFVVAQHLMCIGDDPMHCGTCDSCKAFLRQPNYHADFRMVDAASNSGVDASRRIVEAAQELPMAGRSRVVIVDEAHRLSSEAWDVYLTPLESRESHCVYIFCTTDGAKIPKKIKARCCTARFSRVGSDDIHGLLVRLASQNGISYETEGIRAIAKVSKGHVRDAVALLDTIGQAQGCVNRETVAASIDIALPDMATNVWVHLAMNRFTEACQTLEQMALTYGASKTLEEVFAAFGRIVFGDAGGTPEEIQRNANLRTFFSNYAALTSTLLKWSVTEHIPLDALPLFAHELMLQTSNAPTASRPIPTPRVSVPSPAPPPGVKVVSVENLTSAIGGNVQRK